jgi:hypothetical protein
MLEIVTNFAARHFDSERKLNNLINALDSYTNNRSSLAAQLRLEAAFYQAFKKKASAKLIDRLAKLDCGPLEAFTVFGNSSPAVKYDFESNNITFGRWFKIRSIFRWIISLVLSLSIISFGAAFCFFGFFLMYFLGVQIFISGTSEGMKELARLGVHGFVTGIVGLLSLFGGGNFIYNGFRLIKEVTNESKAEKLFEPLGSNS